MLLFSCKVKLINIDALFGQANDATSQSTSGIASRLAQLVTSTTEVIRISMNDQRAAQDAVGAQVLQGDEGVLKVDLKTETW